MYVLAHFEPEKRVKYGLGGLGSSSSVLLNMRPSIDTHYTHKYVPTCRGSGREAVINLLAPVKGLRRT